MPFSTRRILILDGRQDPTRRPIFLLGNYPRPPSRYRRKDGGHGSICHTSSKGMPRHAHRLWASERYVALY